MAGKAIVTLSRSSVEPFLKSSHRRDLREKVFKAFTARGDNGNANDNNATIVEILALREESARIMGFRPMPPTGWKTPWPRRPRRCAAFWRGSGSRPGPRRWPIATRCRG
jgi:Zn-dependent oligopeptidase